MHLAGVSIEDSLVAVLVAISGGIGAFITWFARALFRRLDRMIELNDRHMDLMTEAIGAMKEAGSRMELQTAVQAESVLAHRKAADRFVTLAEGYSARSAATPRKGAAHA